MSNMEGFAWRAGHAIPGAACPDCGRGKPVLAQDGIRYGSTLRQSFSNPLRTRASRSLRKDFNMKVAVVLACLLVAVAAKPQFGSFGSFGGFGGSRGSTNSGSIQGQTGGLLGNSQIQNSFANAQGSAFGGGSSFNRANSNAGQSFGLFGGQQSASNNAFSNQFGGR
ncbi:heterogeneous nuclear ribonucleoprotein A1-like [Amphibalanus amphitrite]|uniref:heterogeneous nuclear ribonucleoprotein A1-like n=1 Tax=Amphibalanus amphitrite TaxID=1232801 RepID=UPI001C90AECD|nr:heterogeneous nuclear ribonucleoprotein A1-like [Amphibalanus amphitrite]